MIESMQRTRLVAWLRARFEGMETTSVSNNAWRLRRLVWWICTMECLHTLSSQKSQLLPIPQLCHPPVRRLFKTTAAINPTVLINTVLQFRSIPS